MIKEVEISFSRNELRVLEVCLEMAENAEVGKKIRERWFALVQGMKNKVLVASICLDKEPQKLRCQLENGKKKICWEV